MKTKLMYVILIGIAITSISIGTVYAVLSSSVGSGTNFSGATTMYALKISPTVGTTIAHIQVTLPSGFTFPTPRVFNIQNIGAGHISTIPPLTLSYDVDIPAPIPVGTQIVLLVGGIVNTSTLGSGQNVIFTTLDSSYNTIETGSFPLNIVSGIQDITDTGGKVGINNASPASTLDVGGNIGLSGNIVPNNNNPICIGTGC